LNWQNVTVKLSDLQPWEHNPRTMTKRQAQRLLKSWQDLGQFQTIAIGPFIKNGDGKSYCPVYDGHQRLSALQAAHGAAFLIDARQSDRELTDEERRELTVQANLPAGSWNWDALSGWDAAQLQEWGFDQEALKAWNTDAANLATMLTADKIANAAAPVSDGIFTNEQIIDAAFTYFRSSGFPFYNYPIHVSMQEINKLSRTDTEILLHSDTAYHVADTYHRHRFFVSAEGMKSPIDGFNDNKIMRRMITLAIESGYTVSDGAWGKIWIASGVQAASNFRPAFALYLYRRFAPTGATILDTSTGYGGRLVGFMASGLDRYIGIDPNIPTHEGNMRMAHDLGFTDRVELYNLPAEDVSHDALSNRCDFAFTSPPYFSKEHYSEDDTQSWVRYKTGEDWRCGFLLPMMRLQYVALKSDSYSIVNIADVKLRNAVYPLVQWTIDAGKECGFEFINQERFELTRRFGAGQSDEVSYEPVLIFKKA
jgi:hypothetical protein